jgi:HAD superfamily hydrolase (TIGR01484 family)
MNQLLRLLSTDLDRTLLPNGPEPESADARSRFRDFCTSSQVTLAYISGRDRGLVERAIYAFSLPKPHFVISDVGTNIYDLRQGDWQLLDDWHEHIARDWQHLSREQLFRVLGSIRELRLQEMSKQNTWKLSYYFNLQNDQFELNKRLEVLLGSKGIPANLIWSIDEPAGIGLLDVLPPSADKYHALSHLCRLLDIPPESVLYAGDSGNDLPLLSSIFPSVLVANALPRVRSEASILAEKQGNQSRLYLAQGGYLGMNGNYSAGILEALAHFFPDSLADPDP